MYDPSAGFPGVVPEFRYPDPMAAADWLCKHLGFRILLKQPGPDGTPNHIDLATDFGMVMVGGLISTTPASPTMDYQTIVFVKDIDDHYDHLVSHGVRPDTKPATKPWGLRQYIVTDGYGYRWEISQFIRHVPPEEWGASIVDPLLMTPPTSTPTTINSRARS